MKVFPNLGAEEGLSPEALPPAAMDAAQSFCWLFGPEAEVVGGPPAPWPTELGPAPGGPLFDWIEGEAFAWLATAEAQRRLREAGADPRLPDPAVVHRVNDKAFAHRAALRHGLVPAPLLPHLAVLEPAEIEEARVAPLVEALPGWVGRDWVLKPRWGTSGRGRVRRLSDVEGSAERLRRRGGAVFEPWLSRVEDLSALLHVAPDGEIRWIGTTRQRLRGAGIYQGNQGILTAEGGVHSGSPWDDELREAGWALAREAAAAGYFGPLGVDAFVFEGPGGRHLLRPVEMNARFTMGVVAVGILLQAHRAGLLPTPTAWTFSIEGREEGAFLVRLGEKIRLGGTPLA